MYSITALDKSHQQAIQQKIDGKAKPLGSLGKIETLAVQLATILGPNEPKALNPELVVFIADHGITDEGISTAPSAVTTEVARHFNDGCGAINVFTNHCGLGLTLVDAGMKFPLEGCHQLINQRLGFGTQPFHQEAAMSVAQVHNGFDMASDLVGKIHQQGTNIIAFGELGLGNTSSAAALMAAYTKLPVEQCVGYGTGIDEATYQKKLSLIEQALELHQEYLSSPINILARLGGFEIVQMCGAMLSSAERGMVILVDGFIASAAALAAISINPNAKDYMIFCHQSQEKGHQKMLEHIEVKALFDIGLRLGEGTGAALIMPLVNTALGIYNDMADLKAE